MPLTEAEIRDRYRTDEPIFAALGAWVTEHLLELIHTELEIDMPYPDLLKLPPSPRTKHPDKLVEKALWRGKDYRDPYGDITDKVGTRFVVLLRSQLEPICELVEQEELWEASRDRDFADEQRLAPTTFVYQSVHFVVRNRHRVTWGDVEVPAGSPCEIQIRTLLQHAYGELTHDTVYKPRTLAGPGVHRAVAKSMALMETTDDLFVTVYDDIETSRREAMSTIGGIRQAYENAVAPVPDSQFAASLNEFVLHPFSDLVDRTTPDQLIEFARDNDGSPADAMRRRRGEDMLFNQPVVLFLYYLARTHRDRLKRDWPLPQEDLRRIFTD